MKENKDSFITDNLINKLETNLYLLEKKIFERDFDYFLIHIRYQFDLTIQLLKSFLVRNKILQIKQANKLMNFKKLEPYLHTLTNVSALPSLRRLQEIGNDVAHLRSNGEYVTNILGQIRMKSAGYEESLNILKDISAVMS
jgi:hypothetical protein